MSRPEYALRLRLLRLDQDLTGAQLATELGWPASKVSRIETGKQIPTLGDIRAWVTGCGAEDNEANSIHRLVLGADRIVTRHGPRMLGIVISDYNMTRLTNWALSHGYSVDDAISALLNAAAKTEERQSDHRTGEGAQTV